MSTDLTETVGLYRNAHYTGTNGDEIAEWLEAASYSYDGTTLLLELAGGTASMEIGQWLVCQWIGIGYQAQDTINDDYYNKRYATEVPATAARVSALESNVSDQQALRIKQATGSVTIPAGLAVAGTRPFQIAMNHPVDVTLRPDLALEGAQLIGGHTVRSWSWADSTHLDLVVYSLALLSAPAATLTATVPYLG